MPCVSGRGAGQNPWRAQLARRRDETNPRPRTRRENTGRRSPQARPKPPKADLPAAWAGRRRPTYPPRGRVAEGRLTRRVGGSPKAATEGHERATTATRGEK